MKSLRPQILFLLLVLGFAGNVRGDKTAGVDDKAATTGSAERGYHWLTQKAYVTSDLNQDIFDRLWTVWPIELKRLAQDATPAERRKLAFSRYGLTPRPDDEEKPLQYVVEPNGNWTMNCFGCHGGKVLGDTIPGLPNSHFALETLTADVRRVKISQGLPMSTMDAGSLFVPLGRSNGTTNAVMFGVALMAYRNPDLTLRSRVAPRMVHHDMDAPAWWTFKKKSHLYIDGFAEKGVRPLMQFMLVQENGPDHFHRTESEFRDVYTFINSLEAPEYPFEIDATLAEEGRAVFESNCAECHGTYGKSPTYPERLVPLEELGTDGVRLQALTAEERGLYHKSWFAHFGEHDTVLERDGYIAPPLDGIWASAPYLHNGSVPTLWHLLNPSERPAVWKRAEDNYDTERVGLEVEEFERLPSHLRRSDELRTYFNSRLFGKSKAGHDYPDALSPEEKRAVLEYLKTL